MMEMSMDWLFGFSSNAHMQYQPWFVYLDDFKLWAKDRHPSCNVFAYLDMVDERNHATRLEF